MVAAMEPWIIAIVSFLGAAFITFLVVPIRHLLQQSALQTQRIESSHSALLEAISGVRAHADQLHREAMAAITEQTDSLRGHTDQLHREAMAAITAETGSLRDHTDQLHREAMGAIAALDREHRDHREKLHSETSAQISDLGERLAAVEAVAGLRAAV